MILKGKKVCDEETGVIYTVIFVRESDNTLVMRKVENQSGEAEMTIQELANMGYSIDFQTDENKESPFGWFRRMISSEDVKNRRIAVKFDAINGIPEMEEVKSSIINAVLMDPDDKVREIAYKTIETMGWKEEYRHQKKKKHTRKFKVGQTWYMAMKGNPHQCIDVTILEIVSDNRVRVRYNTKKAPEYIVNWAKLHKTPDKTMESRKDKDRANREMEEKKIKSMQQGIRKELIAKVARLSEKGTVYLNEHGNYIIKHVPYFSGGTIKSEEELEKLVDEKLHEIDKIYKKLANMKYILIHDGRGDAIYHINSISKKKHQINCSWCQNQEDIDLSKIIDGRELYMCKIQKNDWMERKRNRYLAQSVTKTK